MKLLCQLFVTFFKIGGLTFGGGYAMLPLLQREVIEGRKWATQEEILDYYAMAQVLPGVIAVNAAIFVGNKVRGRLGGVAAAMGVVAPSLLIILLIAAFLQNIMAYELVQKAFWGIRIVVGALILQAIINLWKTAMKNVFAYVVYGAVLLLAIFTNVPTIAIVLGAVAAGMVYGGYTTKRGQT
jgi:chromate transporter